MLKTEPKQLSLYSILYNKIPENHILKKINSVVDFSFIHELLKVHTMNFTGDRQQNPK